MPEIELYPVPKEEQSMRTYIFNNFRRIADAIRRAPDIVGSKDIEITESTQGLILRAPGGARYRLTVNDAGNLVITAV